VREIKRTDAKKKKKSISQCRPPGEVLSTDFSFNCCFGYRSQIGVIKWRMLKSNRTSWNHLSFTEALFDFSFLAARDKPWIRTTSAGREPALSATWFELLSYSKLPSVAVRKETSEYPLTAFSDFLCIGTYTRIKTGHDFHVSSLSSTMFQAWIMSSLIRKSPGYVW